MTPKERLREMRDVLASIADMETAPTPAEVAALIAAHPLYAKEIRSCAADVIVLATWAPGPRDPGDAPTEEEIEAEFRRARSMPPPRRRAPRSVARND